MAWSWCNLIVTQGRAAELRMSPLLPLSKLLVRLQAHRHCCSTGWWRGLVGCCAKYRTRKRNTGTVTTLLSLSSLSLFRTWCRKQNHYYCCMHRLLRSFHAWWLWLSSVRSSERIITLKGEEEGEGISIIYCGFRTLPCGVNRCFVCPPPLIDKYERQWWHCYVHSL